MYGIFLFYKFVICRLDLKSTKKKKKKTIGNEKPRIIAT